MTAQWQNSRNLAKRLIIRGTLHLTTPSHIGNGDSEGSLDMPLMRDAAEGKALLTGTSIAGALRSYLRVYGPKNADEELFGRVNQEESDQSLLIVDDALSDQMPLVELRDGVALDGLTHTAEDKKKFDIELLCAGSTFPLCFELLIPKGKEDRLKQYLAIALHGLEQGEISLGKRKSRGYGRCFVGEWEAVEYDMTSIKGLVAWLEQDWSSKKEGKVGQVVGAVHTSLTRNDDCILEAKFLIASSLLIRSGSGRSSEPDMVHLRSRRPAAGSSTGWLEVPILSGTSLSGALRSRTVWIANRARLDGRAVAASLFGYRPCDDDPSDEPLTASRLWVDECVIDKPLQLVHSRLKIDRFTGGAYPGALFDEQPVYGAGRAHLQVKLVLRKAENKEIGLLLMLLKDLWTGDLALGGERGIGRGRLQGISATLKYQGETWSLVAKDNNEVAITGPEGRDLQIEFGQPFAQWRQP